MLTKQNCDFVQKIMAQPQGMNHHIYMTTTGPVIFFARNAGIIIKAGQKEARHRCPSEGVLESFLRKKPSDKKRIRYWVCGNGGSSGCDLVAEGRSLRSGAALRFWCCRLHQAVSSGPRAPQAAILEFCGLTYSFFSCLG
ncbi:hypothetical protein CapIbe_007896 [Capra ibex]